MENVYYNKTVEEIEKEFSTSASDGISPSRAAALLRRRKRSSVYGFGIKDQIGTLPKLLCALSVVGVAVLSAMTFLYSDRFVAVSSLVMAFVYFVLLMTVYIKGGKTILKCMKFSVPRVRAVRGGKPFAMLDDCLVPGDLIILSEGDIVPADSVIVYGSVYVLEGRVTGYRNPQKKHAYTENMLGDKNNMLFASSIIKSGECRAIVVACGRDCEVSNSIAQFRTPTPGNLYPLGMINRFSAAVTLAAFVVSVLMIAVSLMRRSGTEQTVLTAFSAVVLTSGLIGEFVFTVTRAVIASQIYFTYTGDNGARSVITNPESLDKLADTDCVVFGADTLFSDNDIEVVAYEVGGNVYAADNRSVISEAALFLKYVSVFEGVESFSIFRKKSKLISSKGQSRTIADFAHGITGDSNFRLAVKKCADEVSDMDRAVIFGREKFAFFRGNFGDVLSRCDTVIINSRILAMDSFRRSEIITLANRFISDGYGIYAYARRTYADGETVSENIPEDRLQFFGIIAYKRKMMPEAEKFFTGCVDRKIRPVIFADNEKYMIRELKSRCPSLSQTRFCVGEKLTDKDKTDETVDNYDFFLALSDVQKSEIVTALTRHGYNVCFYGKSFSDAEICDVSAVSVCRADRFDLSDRNSQPALPMKKNDIIKCAVLSVRSDALTDKDVDSLFSAFDVSKRIYAQLRLMLKYLTGTFIARAAVLLVCSVFGFLAFSPTQMLTLGFYSDILGVLCIVFSPCRSVYDRKKADFSPGFFRNLASRQIPAYAFALSVLIIGIAAHFGKFGFGDGGDVSFIFSSFILMSPVALFMSGRDGVSKYSVAYFFFGIIFVLTLGSVDFLRHGFGISEYGNSIIFSLIPIVTYILTKIICAVSERRRDKSKGEI